MATVLEESEIGLNEKPIIPTWFRALMARAGTPGGTINYIHAHMNKLTS